MKRSLLAIAGYCFPVIATFGAAPLRAATHLMENLGRGVVAVRTSATDAYVSWRVLGTDPAGAAFNLYRSTAGGSPVLLNGSPIAGATLFTDTGADFAQANDYTVRAVIGGIEQPASAAFTLAANTPIRQYLRVPLQLPPGGITLNGNVALRGHVVAPSGTVTINGSSTLTGSVTSDRLTLNGSALLKEAP